MSTSGVPFSIVTINRNNSTGLRRTLDSIATQSSLRNLANVIVVDGASTDDSVRVAQSYKGLPLELISEPDRGVYDALNKGTTASRGDFVIYLNAGDTFSGPDALEIAASVAATHPHCGMLIFGARDMRGYSAYPQIMRNVPYRWLSHALGIQPHCHQSIAFSRSLVEELGGYSEDYAFIGDFDLIMRVGSCSPSHSDGRVIADYEGGGISASRAAEIPALMHRVRSDRFHYEPWQSALDLGFVRALAAYRWFTKHRSSLRTRLKSVYGRLRSK